MQPDIQIDLAPAEGESPIPLLRESLQSLQSELVGLDSSIQVEARRATEHVRDRVQGHLEEVRQLQQGLQTEGNEDAFVESENSASVVAREFAGTSS